MKRYIRESLIKAVKIYPYINNINISEQKSLELWGRVGFMSLALIISFSILGSCDSTQHILVWLAHSFKITGDLMVNRPIQYIYIGITKSSGILFWTSIIKIISTVDEILNYQLD
jgi:hypothetical protein